METLQNQQRHDNKGHQEELTAMKHRCDSLELDRNAIQSSLRVANDKLIAWEGELKIGRRILH